MTPTSTTRSPDHDATLARPAEDEPEEFTEIFEKPGVADALTYSAWAAANGVADAVGTADDDGDGLPNLSEFAVGLNPKTPSLQPAVGLARRRRVATNRGRADAGDPAPFARCVERARESAEQVRLQQQLLDPLVTASGT